MPSFDKQSTNSHLPDPSQTFPGAKKACAERDMRGMDLLPVACVIWDFYYSFENGPIFYASLNMNESSCELFGMSPQEYLNLHQNDSVPMGYRCYHVDDWLSLLRENISGAFSGKVSEIHKTSRICRVKTNQGHVVACLMSSTIKYNDLGLVETISTCYTPLPGQDIDSQISSIPMKDSPPVIKKKY
eukprot:TRINITY_DN3356_c0_g1_i1.p1 TRINITY_DN3356_c0_g1~~TRINITY_DN3356_c0_g1_i1.p1  ORF type:complete len:187 (-),score=18.13 TRINITY_DN3356_c0_g1_i1:167-727(-)